MKYLVRKTGTKGVVIGLSGGKDSAAVAAICARAGVRVLGINLPIKSNPEDLTYVKKLLSVFPQIEFEEHSLERPFESMVFSMALNLETDKITCANIKARTSTTSFEGI